MHPLKGIVVDTKGGRLRVRLVNRAYVHVAKKGLKLGDTCYVLYDYTRLQVNRVWTEDEYAAEDIEPQLEFDEPEEPEHVPPDVVAAQSEGCPGVSL